LTAPYREAGRTNVTVDLRGGRAKKTQEKKIACVNAKKKKLGGFEKGRLVTVPGPSGKGDAFNCGERC